MSKKRLVKIKIEFPEGGMISGELTVNRAKRIIRLFAEKTEVIYKIQIKEE